MFGYVNINRKTLTEEDQKIYQSFYCGLCQRLKEKFGTKGQMLLSYDMTFLVVLLSGLYELEHREKEFICPLHPTKKKTAFLDEVTEYVADMNLILAYHNLLDDWKDEKSFAKKQYAKILQKDYNEIREQYPRQVKAVEHYMMALEEAEKRKEQNLDVIAGYTGEMMEELFDWKEDIWSKDLRCLSFYLGKFIYLMDAYEDMEKDHKRNRYNPFLMMKEQSGDDFETFCRLLLTSMVQEAAKAFERLPIIMYAEILRNVLYSGIWTKYEYIRCKKEKSARKEEK